MASGDLIRRLLLSHKRQDDQAFNQVARELAAEERAKHHNLLADELETILDGTSSRKSRRTHIAERRLAELPRDRERDSLLLEVRTPSRLLSDIVLSTENRCTIEEILREQRQRDLLRTHGLSAPRQILLCGPPGCGKTLCAEVLASELDLPLLYARFDAIVTSYLGETAANLRKIFDFASNGSWVLFFDEFDAIGKSRDDPNEHGELKRVVNSFLQLIDGFKADSVVIAATNHEGSLDAALWRRFDEILLLDRPTPDQVGLFLELKLASIRHADVDLAQLVPKLTGQTYADIERICIDASKMAILSAERWLKPEFFERAILRQKRRLEIANAKEATSFTGRVEDE